MKQFEKQIAVVTGAARGIGAGIADALANQGAIVYVCDILESVGAELVAQLQEQGLQAHFQKLDVTSEADWQALVQRIRADHGRLDILVNNAGIMRTGGIEDVSFEQYKQVMSISADGTYLALKNMVDLLKARTPETPQAAVVNVASIGALRGAAFALSYAANRAAVVSMTNSAALDWASRKYSIRVNAVLPGSVRTELSQQTLEELMKTGMTLEQAIAYMTSLHPIGRLGTVDDVAQAVIYLASSNASFITGTALTVDGGRTAG